MALNIIAAIGKNNELGKDNKLIWSISDDLKFFKEKTWGHDIIMGRKTFESLPHPLKGRKHIVLTRSKEIIGAIVYNDIEKIIKEYQEKEAFIIGGGTIYKQFLDYAQNMYLTLIDSEYQEADTYFPNFNEEDFEKTIIDEGYDQKIDVNYKHVLYKRR